MSRSLRSSFACLTLLGTLGIAQAAPAPRPPILPGARTLAASHADSAMVGEVLIGELGCTACHTSASPRLSRRVGPDLSTIGSRVTPQSLRDLLSDPHAAKPGTTMPDLFHASDAAAKQGAVDFLVHYLVSLGGPISAAPTTADELEVERGRTLFHTVGCIACHNPDSPDPDHPGFPLTGLARKTTVAQLTAFLLDPLKTRPSGRMPAMHLNGSEARELAIYLLRDQLQKPTGSTDRTPGLHYELYPDYRPEKLPDFSTLKPAVTGQVPGITFNVPGLRRHTNYAERFTGAFDVKVAGSYRFTVESDDGSRLLIDDAVVVDNDGVHPPRAITGSIDLAAGSHRVELQFFQHAAGAVLKVSGEGPDATPQRLEFWIPPVRTMEPTGDAPFTVDPQKAAMGKRMFALLGCAACHHVPGIENARHARPLAELDAAAAHGCLSDDPAKAVPFYALDTGQRDAIRAALASLAKDGGKARDPKQQVLATMARMDCFACHVRDGIGGPDAARAALFTTTIKADLGDEGRLPPRLTGAGFKFRAAALQRLLYHGELYVRRAYMATRMPLFGEANLGGLIDALGAADGAAEVSPHTFTPQQMQEGRTLVGLTGLGCVNCHGVLGHASMGMPAPDLSAEFDRLRPAFIEKLLKNPPGVNPGTRMPPFFALGAVSVPGVGAKTVDDEIHDIEAYLSLGASMPLPVGIGGDGSVTELAPVAYPIVHRTFMAGQSPRMIAVGYPERLSVAFDVDVVRLAEAWRGRFFDAKNDWTGRGGTPGSPLGTDVIEMPAGPAVAILPSASSPWPVARRTKKWADDRNVGGRFIGYELDKQRRPTFEYQLKNIRIEETPTPRLHRGGASLVRSFALHADGSPPGGVYLLAAEGQRITPAPGESDTWVVDGKLRVRIAGPKAIERDADGAEQLLVPVNFSGGGATVEVELSW